MMLSIAALRSGDRFRWLGSEYTCVSLTPLYSRRTTHFARDVRVDVEERATPIVTHTDSVVQLVEHVEPIQQRAVRHVLAFVPLLSESARVRIKGLEQAPQPAVLLDRHLEQAGLVSTAPGRPDKDGAVVDLSQLTDLGWEFHRLLLEGDA